MCTMYLGLENSALVNTIAEIDLTHTLDEIMELEFPVYADLFRGELPPLLTGAKWHTRVRVLRRRLREWERPSSSAVTQHGAFFGMYIPVA